MKIILIPSLLVLFLCFSELTWSAEKTSSSQRWVIWSGEPAKTWEDAFVTGNGRHGTMVLGSPSEERIICVHEELFIRGWDHTKVTVPVTSSYLPEVRRLINEGRADVAAKLVTTEAEQQLADMGAKQRWPLIPHPAFDFHICRTDSSTPPLNVYRRQLDLETGEVTVFMDDRIETVFSSRKHNINVFDLKAVNGRKINVELSLDETPGRKGVYCGHNLDSAFLWCEKYASYGWLGYRAAYTNNKGGYEGLARVSVRGGNMLQKDSKLVICDADEVLVIMRITPLVDTNVSQENIVKKELSALPYHYSKLLKPHSMEHKQIFQRVQFDLGCESEWKNVPVEKMLADIKQHGVSPLFLEQLHAMGRYLLISSCGKYPPPLQGIWGGSWKPAWIGGFVWDSNLNLAISAASMGDMQECAETYCKYVEHLLPGWRLNAKNYLGCRGFIVAHYNDPENGYLTHFGALYPWMFWGGGGGWNIRPLYEYAMMMGNKHYLKENVLPLYKELANFYEDYLLPGNDGLLHICPSISPENKPLDSKSWLSKDATMDVAIAREVFSLLLEMGQLLNIEGKDMEKWESILNKLPVYRINEDGALAEWIDPNCLDNYNHRHLSHLYPVFPGTQIGKNRGNQMIIKAAKTALDKRFDFDSSPAHGLIHVALQAVRLGDIEKVRRNIERFCKRGYLYNSLVTSHDTNQQVYNLDAILSFPRLLMEMLVYTENGRIELLLAWPKEYPDGAVKGIRLIGGHKLDIVWRKGELVEAVLHACNSGEYEIMYKNHKKVVQLKQNKSYFLNGNFGDIK